VTSANRSRLRRPAMRLTTSGVVFLILGAALIVCAYRFGLPGLLPAGILLIGLVVLSALIGLFTSTRLDAEVTPLTRRADGHPVTRVGADLDVRLLLHNRSLLPVGAFTVVFVPQRGFGVEQAAHLRGLDGNRRTNIDAGFVPEERGSSGVQRITLELHGPFRLTVVRSQLHGPTAVAVAPPTIPLRSLRRPGAPAPLRDDQRLVRGASTRDFQTREYVPGDDLRHIHWPTTARLGDLVVREEAQEEAPGALLVLDVSGTQGSRTEELITAAVAAVRALLSQGIDVHVVLGSAHHWLRGTAGIDRLDLLAARLDAHQADVVSDDLRDVAEVFIATGDDAAAARITAAVPRGLPLRRWSDADLPASAGGPFGEELQLPAGWLNTSRSRR